MSAPVNRTNIIREPGLVQYNGAYFYSKEAITITQKDEFFDVGAVMFGKIEDRVSDRSYEISFRPVGEWGNLAVLYPYFSTLIGTDIFGTSDAPLTVWTQSGRKYVFVNVAITSLPDVMPKIGDTILGEVTFTALVGKDKTPGDSNAYYTLTAEEEYPGDANFTAANIITQHPLITYNGGGAFATVNGVQIKNTLNLTAKKVNGLGTVGMVLADYQIAAQFQHAGAFEMADILGATGGNQALGLSPIVGDLIIQYVNGIGFYCELFQASMRQASFKFGTGEDANLVQGVECRATRFFSGGSVVPLGTFATGD